MNDDLQKRTADALANPQNMGELADADAIGTVGNAACGDLLRVWVKYKEERGRKVIDRATFQAFGCETAIATASRAMDLIRGKTAEEALSLSSQELAADLGPLPPTRIHCAELVESALRSALASEEGKPKPVVPTPPLPAAPNLLDSFTQPAQKLGGVRVVFLDKAKEATKA